MDRIRLTNIQTLLKELKELEGSEFDVDEKDEYGVWFRNNGHKWHVYNDEFIYVGGMVGFDIKDGWMDGIKSEFYC